METVVVLSFKKEGTSEEVQELLDRMKIDLKVRKCTFVNAVTMPVKEFENEVGKATLLAAQDVDETG